MEHVDVVKDPAVVVVHSLDQDVVARREAAELDRRALRGRANAVGHLDLVKLPRDVAAVANDLQGLGVGGDGVSLHLLSRRAELLD